jgi:hypothetical protein
MKTIFRFVVFLVTLTLGACSSPTAPISSPCAPGYVRSTTPTMTSCVPLR